MERYVPLAARSVLDVGCLAGGFGQMLKMRRASIEVWGIEADPAAAEAARSRLDHVIEGAYPDAAPARRFDCVVFNDVLEHLADPWAALEHAKSLLSPGGVVVASIPNVRYYRVSWSLLTRGKWEYGDGGVLDRTHLRFFTRQTVEELFRSCGYELRELVPANFPPVRSNVGRLLSLFGVRGSDLLAMHLAVVAAPCSSMGHAAVSAP
jgi:2-polyprenyl-3-methyl-5-hydroxy-6-metoxy-1,4-benzoquinol methylase